MKYKQYIFIVIAYSFINAKVVFGQDTVAPTLKNLEFKTLIVEQVYAYSIEKYSPPYELSQVTKGKEDLGSIEGALQAFFSSMRAGDFDWNNSVWTDDSVQINADRDIKVGKKSADWVKEWIDFYAGRKIRLVTLVKFGKYALVEYQTIPKSGVGPITTDTLALVKKSKSWKVIQELASDPILTDWRVGGRVRVAPNNFFK